jgi:penicillin-binding protein 1A
MKADVPLVPRAAPPPAPKPQPARKGRFRWLRRLVGVLFGLVLALGIAGAIAGFAMFQHYAEGLPDHERLRDYQPPVMSRVYAGDGRLLSELAAERRIFVPVENIPPLVRQAFLSAEDQNFYAHRGVDPIAVVRAVVVNVQNLGQSRRPVGASTITQQVAKNMLLGNEVSFSRKVREAILSVRMEQALSKDRILELYLNEIFLGRGAYGVASAAMTYFNKALDELSPAEAAFLAALPKAPNNYDPFRFPDAAKARRDWVLDRMAEDRFLALDQAAAAKNEAITVRAGRLAETVPAAYYAEEVRRQLIEKFGAEAATQGGLLVRTSLDPDLQVAADRALRDGLIAYDRRRGGWRGPLGVLDMPAAQFATGWTQALANAQPPGGAPREWRMAAVLSVDANEARVGILDRATRPGVPPQPKILALPMAEMAWARKVLEPSAQQLGPRLGPAPRRPADVLEPGQVVLVEVLPATAGTPGEPAQRGRAARPGTPGLPERASLRQMPAVEGALVALDPRTGRVLAMSGGWSFDRSQFNRATQAQRQPGSSFKPFVYIVALERGMPPTERIEDAPYSIPQGPGQPVWTPQNYTREFYGPTPMRIGMEKSRNLMTIRLAETVGLAAVADSARRFGVIPNMLQVPSMALGAGETTVARQAAAYAAFANGGRYVTPTVIDSVQDRDGRVIFRADARDCTACRGDEPTEPPVLPDVRREITDRASAYQMTSFLQGAILRGTGGRASLGARPVAGKTGTTNDYLDAWFVGYTPDLVTAVWIGNDGNASLGEGETGGNVAAPVFRAFMEAALQGRPALPFRTPPGLRLVRINPATGELAAPGDRGAIFEAFKPGTEPTRDGPSGLPSAAVGAGLGGVY